jgi:DNA polymerase III subunit delta'
MKSKTKAYEIVKPKNQLFLHGYEKYFKSFIKLVDKNELPSVILLTGHKGIGKSTFAYHFINFIFSKNEENTYSLNEYKINSNNRSYNLLAENIHPNFFLLESDQDKETIKIEQIRHLLKFLNKSTYSNNLKIVFLDNAEYLNINSSNALLKALEEPPKNTHFFIIHNDESKIKNTIISRCIKFRIHFKNYEKKNIFNKISQNYDLDFNEDKSNDFFHFESPGNILIYLLLMNEFNCQFSGNNLPNITYLLEKCSSDKNPELLNLIVLLIENYYNLLSLSDINNVNYYSMSKNKILNLIHSMKKFNLDKKNILISINKILKNEEK